MTEQAPKLEPQRKVHAVISGRRRRRQRGRRTRAARCTHRRGRRCGRGRRDRRRGGSRRQWCNEGGDGRGRVDLHTRLRGPEGVNRVGTSMPVGRHNRPTRSGRTHAETIGRATAIERRLSMYDVRGQPTRCNRVAKPMRNECQEYRWRMLAIAANTSRRLRALSRQPTVGLRYRRHQSQNSG